MRRISILKSVEATERDVYYDYLMRKYKEYDLYDLVEMITEQENQIREYLELRAVSE